MFISKRLTSVDTILNKLQIKLLKNAKPYVTPMKIVWDLIITQITDSQVRRPMNAKLLLFISRAKRLLGIRRTSIWIITFQEIFTVQDLNSPWKVLWVMPIMHPK